MFVRDDGELIVVAGLNRAAASTRDLIVAAYRQPDCTAPNDAFSDSAFEYYDASLDHYFITTFADDMNALDSGRFPGWLRTGYTLSASRTSTDLSPVCRFISHLWLAIRTSFPHHRSNAQP